MIEAWEVGGDKPGSDAAIASLTSARSDLNGEIERIEKAQGEHTYANALKTTDDLIELKYGLAHISRSKEELEKIHTELNRQASAINHAIAHHINQLIGELRKRVNSIYKGIQGDDQDVPLIRLELPPEDETNQQRIHLKIDFAENRKGVIPSGYLSDSQVHTLALSLRLAAIQLFNRAVPLIVLDDVVTSYDVDHRKTIASVLTEKFGDFQIILVTHDDQFFRILQDHLPQSDWRFRRIIKIEDGFGPKFHDHRVPDEEVQKKHDDGDSAANEIRQVEEDWLTDIGRAFRVWVTMRPILKPYEFGRAELAAALAQFLKTCGILPPKVSGIANPFLSSLMRGDVENFGSHFSDNPSGSRSLGDEKKRWKEFTYFRDQFCCPNCGKKKFMRPDPLTIPVCQKCNTPFSFKDQNLDGKSDTTTAK